MQAGYAAWHLFVLKSAIVLWQDLLPGLLHSLLPHVRASHVWHNNHSAVFNPPILHPSLDLSQSFHITFFLGHSIQQLELKLKWLMLNSAQPLCLVAAGPALLPSLPRHSVLSQVSPLHVLQYLLTYCCMHCAYLCHLHLCNTLHSPVMICSSTPYSMLGNSFKQWSR